MDDEKRLYGVDLFKALSMLLVVALHINTVGGALEGSAAGSAQWWIADFVQIAAYCCVDCFALATGFLMAGRRFRPGRIVSLWLQAAFYSVVTAITWYFTVPGKIDLKYIVSSFFTVLTSKYWYFTAYFVLFFFTPFLNAMLRALDTHGRKMLLAAIFVFLSLLPTFRPLSVIPLSGGYCFFWLAALYLIGGCVKLDGLYEKASGKFFVLAYFASAALMLLWQAVLGADDVLLIGYLSPTVLLCAAALLCAFCRLRVPDKLTGAAKLLSTTSFGVYLIHISPFILSTYLAGGFAFIGSMNALLVLPCELGCALAIYAVCTLTEYLRQRLFKLCRIDRLAAAVSDRLDSLGSTVGAAPANRF